MSYKQKEKNENNSKRCVGIAKDLLSIGNIQKAEAVLVTALNISHDEEAQSLLDDIKDEKFNINEKRRQLEIEAKTQLEDAKYAEMNTNRFKMRAKVLSLEVSVILRKYENDFARQASTAIPPVSDTVENFLVKVHKALNKADFGEAEKYLKKAERIYDDEYAKIPKNIKSKNNHNTTPIVKELVIPKHTPGAREKAELKGNEGDENRCIRIAEAAMKNEDYAKAEKFLLKAERLRPTTVAKKLLLVVRDMASKKESVATTNDDKSSQDAPGKLASHEPTASDTTGEDNQKMAEKITRIAETSFNEGNYERAKSMLEKAEQIFSTTAAKDLLHRIHDIKAEKEAFDTLNTIFTIVFKWISEAKDIDYNIAEKMILDLEKKIPHVDVAEILSDIRAVRASRSSTKEIISEIKDDVYYKNKQLSEICLDIANDSKQASNLIAAKEFLRLALNFKANESVKSLLNEFLEKYPPGEIILQQKEVIYVMKRMESENLILKAEEAFSKGLLEKSEQLLLIAKELHPQEQIEVILGDIYAAKDAVSNYKSQGRSETTKRCQPSTTHKELSDAHAVPLYSAAVKKTNESRESSQLTGVHRTRDSFVDNLEHKSAGHQSCKNEHSAANAHLVSPVTVIKVEAQRFFEMAQQAFTDQQYDKAEHFILKAHSLSPSNEAIILLEDIQAAKREEGTKKYEYSENNANYYQKTNTHAPLSEDFETVENDKRIEAENSIKIAQTALSSGDLERAERLLQKAERIFPTEQAELLLEDISLRKNKNNAKDDYNQPSTSHAFNKQIDEVNNLINMAFEYMDKQEFRKAELFFEIAYLLYPVDYTRDLLHQVQEELEKKKIKKPKEGKHETRHYMDTAEKALKAGNIIEAETLLIVATSLHQSKCADEFLMKIRQRQTSKTISKTQKIPTGKKIDSSTVRGPINTLNDFKADEYINMAVNAKNAKNFVLAEHFLLKAITLSPTANAENFLNDIVCKKNKAIASKSTGWKFW